MDEPRDVAISGLLLLSAPRALGRLGSSASIGLVPLSAHYTRQRPSWPKRTLWIVRRSERLLVSHAGPSAGCEIARDTTSESTADIDLLVRPFEPIAVVTVR